MYNKTILDNGIKVISEQIPHFRSASIGIWVQAGSWDETPENSGISHFMEHIFFKGTERLSARQIAEIMDGVGGHLNAFTEKEQTALYAKVVDTHIPLALEILADMLINPKLDPEEIEREKGVILEEIRSYEDSPEEQAFDLFNQTLLGKHPLGYPILGTKEVVRKITREDLAAYLDTRYRPENLIICAAGNVEHEQLLDLIVTHFGGMKKGNVPLPERKPARVHLKNVAKFRQSEQTYLTVGGKGLSQKAADKYVFFILDSILGGSMSSRLFQEVREKRGLVYAIFSFINFYQNCGFFGIHAGCNDSTYPKVLDLILEICGEFCEKGITEEELVRSKEHIKGGILLALESTSNRMIRLAKSETYHGRLVPVEEIVEKVEKVTREQVNRMAQSLLDFDQFTQVILGPVTK